MEGKFNIWQKCLEIVCFVLILASSIYLSLIHISEPTRPY